MNVPVAFPTPEPSNAERRWATAERHWQEDHHEGDPHPICPTCDGSGELRWGATCRHCKGSGAL